MAEEDQAGSIMQPESAMLEIQRAAILGMCNAVDVAFSSGHQIEVFYTNLPIVKDLINVFHIDEGFLFSTTSESYIPVSFKKDMNLDVALYRGDGSLISKAVPNEEGMYYTSFPYNFVLKMPQGTLPEGNFKFVM